MSRQCFAISSNKSCGNASMSVLLRDSGFPSTARLLPLTRAHRVASREELPEAAKVSRTAEEYLLELETQDDESHPDSPPGKPPSLTDTDGKVSTSDPDAAWASKGAPIHLSYYDNYLIDNGSNIIVDVEATPARTSQEIVAARLQLRANFEGRKRRSDRLSDDSSTPLSSTASTVFGTASRQQERRRL